MREKQGRWLCCKVRVWSCMTCKLVAEGFPVALDTAALPPFLLKSDFQQESERTLTSNAHSMGNMVKEEERPLARFRHSESGKITRARDSSMLRSEERLMCKRRKSSCELMQRPEVEARQ